MLGDVLKRRLRATIVLASLLGATGGYVAAIAVAEQQPTKLARCQTEPPLIRAAVCIVTDSIKK